MIYYFVPYSTEQNLGKEYNHYCSIVPNEEDYIVLLDGDVMFQNAKWGMIVKAVAEEYGDYYDVFTCLTNRISADMFDQRVEAYYDPTLSLAKLADAADEYSRRELVVSPTHWYFGGYFMMFKKKFWLDNPFPEVTDKGGMLGVDTTWSRTILDKGAKAGVIQNLFVTHSYRANKDVGDRKHLYYTE